MAEKKCNNCGNDNDSFAMELLKGYSAQAKRWFIACMVILSMWLITIGGFIYYLNQYDFESYEITADGDSTEYEYFLSECPFTDEEKQVFDLRRKGKSITSISLELNMSESTVSRRIKSITKKVKKAI